MDTGKSATESRSIREIQLLDPFLHLRSSTEELLRWVKNIETSPRRNSWQGEDPDSGVKSYFSFKSLEAGSWALYSVFAVCMYRNAKTGMWIWSSGKRLLHWRRFPCNCEIVLLLSLNLNFFLWSCIKRHNLAWLVSSSFSSVKF